MNLKFSPSPDVRGAFRPSTAPVRFSAEHLATRVQARLDAKAAEKTSALAELAAACAAAERDEVELGSGAAHTGSIDRLVQRITQLEGEIEHLTQAVTGLEA